ncbi:unnamed protein product, partial [Prorocentrum cordatum]
IIERAFCSPSLPRSLPFSSLFPFPASSLLSPAGKSASCAGAHRSLSSASLKYSAPARVDRPASRVAPMPTMRGWLVVACVPTAFAQLVFWPYEQLKAEAKASSAELERETDAPEGFVSPTLCDPSVNQTAGYLSAGPLATKYFFWLFESKSDPVKDPLIIWLSGGPGCSSQLALFAENGPCKVSKDGKRTTANPYSWHSKANVMWVDQPAGVGFSTSIGTHDEDGVANNMYTFLQNFYKQFPRYMGNQFYLFGESYAGHYVPAISHRVWRGNKAGEGVKIPLAGLVGSWPWPHRELHRS